MSPGYFPEPETCKICKQHWLRYRFGPYDYQYRDCPKCEGRRFAQKKKEPPKEPEKK